MRKILCSALLGLAIAGQAQADDVTVSRTPASAPVLGTVIRGASATTYSISTNGVVTRTAGDAIRLSNASVDTPTITLSCGWVARCLSRPVRVTIRPGGNAGDASIVKLRRGSVSGYGYSISAVSEGQTLVFDLPVIGPFRQVTFDLGMDVKLEAGAQARVHTFSYTVTADFH